MAVGNITPKMIQKLEKLNDEMRRYLEKNGIKAITIMHEDFHQMIFDSADNLYISKLTKELRSASVIIRNFSYSRYSSILETKQQLLDEHNKMIQCLKKEDRDGISKLSRSHIRACINSYLRYFFRRKFSKPFSNGVL